MGKGYKGGSGETRPAPASIGFADALRQGNRSRRSYQSSKRFSREPDVRDSEAAYEWPRVVVARKMDHAHKDSKGWREYLTKQRVQNQYIGRALAQSEIMCVYFTPEEMNSMLKDKYPKLTKHPSDKLRRKQAREDVDYLNRVVTDLKVRNADTVAARHFHEDGNLDDYFALPENKYDVDDRNVAAAQDELWAPSSFRLGSPRGVGGYAIGLALEDANGIFRQERAELAEFMASSLHYNTSLLSDAAPVIATYDTTPRPVAGLRFASPIQPLSVRLKEPHAYMDDRRA
jgi:hypothetical protein